MIAKGPKHEKDGCDPADDEFHVRPLKMRAWEEHRHNEARREEQLAKPFLRLKLALDILVSKVNSGEHRLIEQYV